MYPFLFSLLFYIMCGCLLRLILGLIQLYVFFNVLHLVCQIRGGNRGAPHYISAEVLIKRLSGGPSAGRWVVHGSTPSRHPKRLSLLPKQSCNFEKTIKLNVSASVYSSSTFGLRTRRRPYENQSGIQWKYKRKHHNNIFL